MNCPHCKETVELLDAKNKDTGMFYNYWWCGEHGRVSPQPKPKAMHEIINQILASEIDRQVKGMMNDWQGWDFGHQRKITFPRPKGTFTVEDE